MKESSWINRFKKWIIEHPYQTLCTGLVLVGLISFGVSKLHTDFSYRIWFKQDNPKLAVFDAFERQFGSDEVAVVVMHSTAGIFEPESAKIVQSLTQELWHVPEVIRVDSLSNFQWVRAEGDDILIDYFLPEGDLTPDVLSERKTVALTHHSLTGYLINKEADTTLFFVRLKPSLNGTPDYDKIAHALKDAVHKYQQVKGVSFYITGNPMINYAFKDSTQQDMEHIIPVVLLVTVVFLLVNFRRIAGVIFPFIIILVTIITSLGFIGWTNIAINNLTSVVPQFMIAISVAVAVHILVTFFQFLRKGMAYEDALNETVQKNFLPTFLTAVSTAIGFYSFVTAEIPPIVQMGIMAGTGTLFSWIFTFLIMIPLLRIIKVKPSGKFEHHSATDLTQPSAFSIRLTVIYSQYRYVILGVFGLISVGSILLALQANVNSDPFKYFSKHYPLTIATDFVESKVGGAVGVEIVVDSGAPEGIKDPEFMAKVNAFQQWLDQFEFITKTVSIVDILKDMNQSLHGGLASEYRLPTSRDEIAQQLFLYQMSLPQGLDINDRVTVQNDAIRLTAMWTIHDSDRGLMYIDIFENKAKELGLNAIVTGKIPLYQSNNDEVVFSFLTSLSVALVLIAILLIIGLKSVRIGLLSMLPNAMPLLVGGGLLTLFHQPLDIGTVIVGSVCLGIAVDDTIHFLTNYQKYISQGDDPKTAIAKVITHTGPALVTTTVVLVFAFGSFMLGTFVPNQNFGKFVALILSFALVADLVFLPTLLLTVDKSTKPGQS